MKIWEPINKICEWIINLALLNILWILFTLLGLGVFGWAPATTAMLSILRKQANENSQFSIFHQYWKGYKQDFFQANLIGYLLIVGIASLGISFNTLPNLNQTLILVLGTIFLMMTFLLGIILIFIFPVYAHYDTSIKGYFKAALLVGISNLHYILIIITMLIALYMLFSIIPGLLLFFSVSLPAKYMMFFTLDIVNKIKHKQPSVKEKTLKV